jgi:hypothetical protein
MMTNVIAGGIGYIMKRQTHRRRLLLLHREEVDYSNVHKLIKGGSGGITGG